MSTTSTWLHSNVPAKRFARPSQEHPDTAIKRGVVTPTSPAAPDNNSGRVAPDNNTGHRAGAYCQIGSPNCAGKTNCQIGSPNCAENCQIGNSAGKRTRSGRHPGSCGSQRGHWARSCANAGVAAAADSSTTAARALNETIVVSPVSIGCKSARTQDEVVTLRWASVLSERELSVCCARCGCFHCRCRKTLNRVRLAAPVSIPNRGRFCAEPSPNPLEFGW